MLDVIAVGRRRRQVEPGAATLCVVEREHLVQHDREGTAIEQDVREGPEHLPALRAESEQRQPHERRLPQIEAAIAIDAESLRETRGVLGGRHVAPVLDGNRDFDARMHLLDGLFDVLPAEARA